MRLVALMVFCVGVTNAVARTVTVLVDFEKPHSAVSMTALRQELTDLLGPAGVAVDLMVKSEMPSSPEFSELAVFHMKGSCSMNAKPATASELSDEPGPLAMAYSSDGQILHFGAVECDRVRRCVQHVLLSRDLVKDQAAFGVALGVVMAHELYHMMAGAKAHTKNGLTKESLSPRELVDGRLALPGAVREALRRGGLPPS